MERGKQTKKMTIIIIVTLILAIAIGIIIFAVNRPRQAILAEDMEVGEQMVYELPSGRGTEITMDNQDYIENQVITVTDSKREAKKIAKQIGGELLSYDNNVAVIQIGVTVEEMMQMLEEDSSLPKVYPNYQNYSN